MSCGGCNHGLVKQAGKYLSASAWWVASGMPKRTKEQIEHIFRNICEPCDRFERIDETHGHCTSCSCRISTDLARTNKIFFGTEECPLNKWKKTT